MGGAQPPECRPEPFWLPTERADQGERHPRMPIGDLVECRKQARQILAGLKRPNEEDVRATEPMSFTDRLDGSCVYWSEGRAVPVVHHGDLLRPNPMKSDQVAARGGRDGDHPACTGGAPAIRKSPQQPRG